MQQHLKMLPTNRKVVSADCDSSGPVSEIHLRFRIGKVVLNNVFVILNNLQCNIILDYLGNKIIELVAPGTKKVSISLLLKTNS